MTERKPGSEGLIIAGDFVVDPAKAGQIREAGRYYFVLPQEFAVFSALAASADTIVPYDDFANLLWNRPTDKYLKSRLMCVLTLLRSKIDDSDSASRKITTISGVGLRLNTTRVDDTSPAK